MTMHPATDPVLEARFVADFPLVHPTGTTLLLELTALQAWVVFSNLQLALRHPENAGETREIVEAIARSLQEQLAPPGTVLATVAEMGWHREHDR